jgi:hypothetical protein
VNTLLLTDWQFFFSPAARLNLICILPSVLIVDLRKIPKRSELCTSRKSKSSKTNIVINTKNANSLWYVISSHWTQCNWNSDPGKWLTVGTSYRCEHFLIVLSTEISTIDEHRKMSGRINCFIINFLAIVSWGNDFLFTRSTNCRLPADYNDIRSCATIKCRSLSY